VGGTIVGGTVRTVGSAHLLMPAGSTGTLTGVTLDTDLALPTMGTVTVTGGLTLLNRQITGDTTRLLFSGSNAQTLGGDGSLAYGTNVGNQIQNLSTNTVTVGPGITIHGRSLIIQGGSGGILNQGTIAADAGGIVQLYNVTNQGTLDLSAGATRVNGLLASATPLTLSGGINGGSLGGTGTVRAAIIDGGIISPGPGGIGTLTIDGPVTLTSGGRVLIELSGTARTDLLKISGNLDLSAADDYLDVSKLTTPAMPFGTSFIVATYGGALTGSFDHVTPGYAVSYSTPGQVIVTAVPEPTAAALIGAGVAAFLSSGRRRRTLQRANSKVNTALRR
jgi:fibronectin-binding autotransporter adhesin